MESNRVLREKIMKGMRLAINRLIEERQKTDDYLIISENGKIVKIKARKLNLRKEK
jgi:hypothetical protein